MFRSGSHRAECLCRGLSVEGLARPVKHRRKCWRRFATTQANKQIRCGENEVATGPDEADPLPAIRSAIAGPCAEIRMVSTRCIQDATISSA